MRVVRWSEMRDEHVDAAGAEDVALAPRARLKQLARRVERPVPRRETVSCPPRHVAL